MRTGGPASSSDRRRRKLMGGATVADKGRDIDHGNTEHRPGAEFASVGPMPDRQHKGGHDKKMSEDRGERFHPGSLRWLPPLIKSSPLENSSSHFAWNKVGRALRSAPRPAVSKSGALRSARPTRQNENCFLEKMHGAGLAHGWVRDRPRGRLMGEHAQWGSVQFLSWTRGPKPRLRNNPSEKGLRRTRILRMDRGYLS